MKKQIQQTIKPKYSVGNHEITDFLPVVIAVVLAFSFPLPFGFKALIIYVGWELVGAMVTLKKHFSRSFISHAKYKLGLLKSNDVPKHNIKEFAG